MVASGPQEPGTGEPLSRIEREVLEILEKTEQEKPPVTDMVRWKASRRQRQLKQQVLRLLRELRQRLTPGVIFMFGITFAILAIAMRHGAPLPARVAAFLALGCLVAPFIIVLRRPVNKGPVKTWRGRDISLSPEEPSPVDALRRWWKTRR